MNLTDEDRAAIVGVRAKRYLPLDECDELYRAGLAAGRARAIEECAKVCDGMNRYRIPEDCAEAIRDLLDES